MKVHWSHLMNEDDWDEGRAVVLRSAASAKRWEGILRFLPWPLDIAVFKILEWKLRNPRNGDPEHDKNHL